MGTQTLGNDGGKIQISQFNQGIPGFTSNSTYYFPNPIEQLRIDFSNSQLVLDGVVEITPRPALSARVRGSASVLNADRSFTLVSGPQPYPIPIPKSIPDTSNYGWGELSTTIKPQFWLWEAAGLYNLSYEGGYRYSFVAGYRQESWSYPTSNGQENLYLRDDFLSQIPFIGLQTTMVSPSWKARFEVLGSPFMIKKVAHTARDQGYYMQLDGKMTNGGFIEFQVEGDIPVAPNTWLGLYTQYTYESLKGKLTGVSVDGNGAATYVPTPYDFYTLRSVWTIGLNCNILF